MVYIPVDSDQVLSSSRQTQEYDRQEAFAPDFVPVVQGRRAVKKQTEPNFRAKVLKMGSNLTSMRQVLHSHHSGNLPPPPPPTGAKALPPPVMNDPHPGMRTTTGIISKDAPQLHLPPPPPPTAEHPHTKINQGMNAEQLQYSLELELASMTKNENTLSGQFSFQHSRLKLHRLGLHHLRQTKVQLYGSDIPVQTVTTQDGGKRWDKTFCTVGSCL